MHFDFDVLQQSLIVALPPTYWYCNNCEIEGRFIRAVNSICVIDHGIKVAFEYSRQRLAALKLNFYSNSIACRVVDTSNGSRSSPSKRTWDQVLIEGEDLCVCLCWTGIWSGTGILLDTLRYCRVFGICVDCYKYDMINQSTDIFILMRWRVVILGFVLQLTYKYPDTQNKE